MSYLSERMNSVKPSPTLAIAKLAAELRAAGQDIIGLSQGEPDFDTPDHIKAAAKEAIDRGETKYTTVDGTPQFKDAIIRKFERENGISYSARQISAGTGGKQVIFNALLATLSEGDEVIIPAPYWVSYPDMVLLAGGVPVTVECPAAQAFKLTAAQLSAAITPRTKWLVINSPGNPTGSGYSAQDLRELANVLLANPHVLVMTDDMYEHIRFDGWEFHTIAQVEPRLKSRTLTVNGVSKAYAMTGWRIGYAGGPEELIAAMATVQSQSTTNPNSIAQAASVAALDGPTDFMREFNRTYQVRRDMCLQAFNSIEGMSCRVPEGAFYLYPACSGFVGRKTPTGTVVGNDTDFVRFLLEEAKVAVVPGAAFGLEGYFRMSFATSTARLEAACQRIREACTRLV